MPPYANGISTKFFAYQMRATALAPAGSQTVTIQIQADAFFTLTKITYLVDLAGAALTTGTRIIPLVTLQLQDTGGDDLLFSNPLPLDCVGGNGGLPFILPAPKEFRPNAAIQGFFTNYSAAETYANVYVALLGYKTFKR